MNWIKAHARIVAGVAAVGFAGLIVLVVWFQPQTAFIDDVINDTIPESAAQTSSADDETETEPETPQVSSVASDEPEQAEQETTEPAEGEVPPSFPLTLGEGTFIDLAHTGSGVARILELEDGTRILRFEDLDVLNGPDLRVILSPSALVEDDGAYDDGAFVDLGPLKGNKGDQNYEIPSEVDLDDFATVAIWCRRFNVSFNAAPIA